MSVPLATLRRGGGLAWLHDALDLPLPYALERKPGMWQQAMRLDVRRGDRRRFSDASQAGDWLSFWRTDVAALLALRQALQRSDPGTPLYDCADEEVLLRVAARLVQGGIIAIEGAEQPAAPIMPAAPAPPAVAEPPAVPLSALAVEKPPAPPLLPILEEVQIEGAEVLPEIEQSLEQVDITIGEIKLAPESLEPTPSKVPNIAETMSGAAKSVTGTLDSL